MRFLADENFPGVAVRALRDAGFDVAWVRTDSPGSSDEAVLARSKSEGRVLLTFDKDFGELAFRRGIEATSGVILFRLLLRSPAELTPQIVKILRSRTEWEGYFSVVEPGRVRMRPLPRRGSQPRGS